MPPQAQGSSGQQALNAAIARRAQGDPSAQLNQQSQQVPGGQQMPPQMTPSAQGQASLPQGQPPAQPKFQPQEREDLIVMALIEELKNSAKLKKEQAAMQQPQASQQPQAPQGGGNGMTMGNRVNNFSTSMTQPWSQGTSMSTNQMQRDYPFSQYTGGGNSYYA